MNACFSPFSNTCFRSRARNAMHWFAFVNEDSVHFWVLLTVKCFEIYEQSFALENGGGEVARCQVLSLFPLKEGNVGNKKHV